MNRLLVSAALVPLLALLNGCGGGSPSTSGPPGSPPAVGLTIYATSFPGATAGVPYRATFSAQNGTPPYKWDSPSGGLPSNFSLSQDGVLSGTWPVNGGGNAGVPFTMRVTDSAATPNSTTTTLKLNIFGVGPTTLPVAQVGVDFSQQSTLVAAGGTLPLTWNFSGTAPPGLVWGEDPASPDGCQYGLSGAPTRSGEFHFSITVSDSAKPRRSETVSYTVQVEPAALKLPHLLLPNAAVGHSYNFPFVLEGGAAPYRWSISSPEAPYITHLPDGLQFDTANGRMFGIPTATGYAQFILDLYDSSVPNPQHVSQNYWILVTPGALPPRNDSIATATPIYPGSYNASISPFGDPQGTTGPDQDYYQLTAAAGSTVTIVVAGGDRSRVLAQSTLDPVLEIVDGNGQHYITCNDPYDDNPPTGVPITKDATPSGFDDPCVNHGGDPNNFIVAKYSRVEFKVPGDFGEVTFYIRVFDFRGDARPDMFYTLTVQ